MKYLKIWTNFREITAALELDEVGKLFEMMLLYAETGEEPTEFTGNERFIWPVAKQQIDMASEKNEKLRENGLKGGRPKTKENQTKPDETKDNQTKAEKKRKEIERKEIERKEIERNEKENTISSISLKENLIDDNDAHQIQQEQNRVLDAAEDAGFKISNDVRASLIALYADSGLEKVLDGLKSCSEHGAANLAYLRAVLRGTPKKKPTGKVMPAQNFPQRDYSGVENNMMDDLAREIEAMRRNEA